MIMITFALIDILCYIFFLERNGLSFIETSALDSTNVENAFQNILTGGCVLTSATVSVTAIRRVHASI